MSYQILILRKSIFKSVIVFLHMIVDQVEYQYKLWNV